ncbi:pyruvate carboxylase [Limosilactobacillus coleohominis DSM 14060]|nr:pyruvate carboxylase [Limosilactobacillus coleohominis DSM 14060]
MRLDGGNTYAGAVVTPYFDSLLVKACVHARTFHNTVEKMIRVLNEFQIRGVKTNIPFMLNVLKNPVFQKGEAHTAFIDQTPSLFKFDHQPDTQQQLLNYVGDVTVNGFNGVQRQKQVHAANVKLHGLDLNNDSLLPIVNAKTILDRDGVAAAMEWVKNQKLVLLTDTSMRDAHQSLFATRMRTHDMLPVADVYDRALPNVFSAETWGLMLPTGSLGKILGNG